MNLTPTTPVDDDNTEPGPFIELSRESWAALSDSTEIDIDEATLTTSVVSATPLVTATSSRCTAR